MRPMPFVLERQQRMSKSMVWRLQRRFFEEQGLSAWSTGTVPHYITNNPFIARRYAELLLGWLDDCAPLDPREPVYLVELGAGAGRFAFHLVRALVALWRRSSAGPPP